MNIEYVKKITGINQEKTLRKYLKIAEDMADSQMDNTGINLKNPHFHLFFFTFLVNFSTI